jgi:hypothetical protein
MSRPAAIQPHQYAELARLHVAGWSDARIAAALGGCDRSTVTRTRKRPLLVEMIAAERKREQTRLRQAAKRDRDRAAKQPEPVVATEPVAAAFEDDPGRQKRSSIPKGSGRPRSLAPPSRNCLGHLVALEGHHGGHFAEVRLLAVDPELDELANKPQAG